MFDPRTIAKDCFAVTTSDIADLPDSFIGFYVGTTGNVVVLTHGGRTVTFTAVPAGAVIPIKARRIKATSTTASNIVGFLA